MSTTVGKSVPRVDAYDKVTGRTKYYEDRMPAGALYIRVKHSEIAHGFVKSIDTAAAEAVDGVVRVLTCFDVPDIPFPTAGHPWSDRTPPIRTWQTGIFSTAMSATTATTSPWSLRKMRWRPCRASGR